MLGSGDAPGPITIPYKKVEHRDKILYYGSTATNNEKENHYAKSGLYKKLLDLKDVIIMDVQNIR